MNVAAYMLYLSLTYLVTVHVGLRFYRHGYGYILYLFRGDASTAGATNRLLLVGYYLLNGGYAALMLRSWRTVYTWSEVLATCTHAIGRILLTLACVHYLNMLAIYLHSKHKTFHTPKNPLL